MNTFLPETEITGSVACLDNIRLNNQVRECKTMLTIIRKGDVGRKGYGNHPCTKMWALFSEALVHYMNACIREKIKRRLPNYVLVEPVQPYALLKKKGLWPWWLGVREFHISHQSNLLRKDPEWYGQFGWGVRDDYEYVWPRKDFILRKGKVHWINPLHRR